MKRRIIGLAVLVATAGQASAATIIDFDSIASGINVTSVGDATFSLAGIGESGAPSTGNFLGDRYLWNSTDGLVNPTSSILKVEFHAAVSGVSFDFNNGGSLPTSTWALYDAGGAPIASGLLTPDHFLHTYDVSSYTGVKAAPSQII